jgi:hypothetical protein
MTEEPDRCADEKRLRRIDEALASGDMALLRAAVDDPPDFPSNVMPMAIGPILTSAIYHSPLRFIEELLALGADPNGHDHDGFPPLIAALCKTHPHAGSPARDDVVEVMARLLDAGADRELRTRIDDCDTPLEMAKAGAVRRPECKAELAAIVRLLERA